MQRRACCTAEGSTVNAIGDSERILHVFHGRGTPMACRHGCPLGAAVTTANGSGDNGRMHHIFCDRGPLLPACTAALLGRDAEKPHAWLQCQHICRRAWEHGSTATGASHHKDAASTVNAIGDNGILHHLFLGGGPLLHACMAALLGRDAEKPNI
jgi:hypothetical protein